MVFCGSASLVHFPACHSSSFQQVLSRPNDPKLVGLAPYLSSQESQNTHPFQKKQAVADQNKHCFHC